MAEFARFAAEVITPTNRDGDRIGSRLDPDTGHIVTPPSFPPAYRQFVDAGWNAVPVPVDHGGAGLPHVVGVALQELFAAANVGLSLCPALTQSAIELLITRGTPEQQARYLPRLVTGEWAGTMWITESQAGSDVGAIRMAATRRDDGAYELRGNKIFISWGDHDLTDNILHFVLARTPGSAPGTRGLSLFLVPDRLIDDAGRPGERNHVHVVSLEHKTGLHASPTCVMELDGAVGELIGEEGDGMRSMFVMMNPARLSIGLQGLGVGESAYRRAREFAAGRVQGGVPIDQHPDVRRMLSQMSALVDAMRLLVYETARQDDIARSSNDPGDAEHARLLVDLFTPITKAWVTDTGVEVASLGVQVHGGMGYIEESGAPQLWRDARISSIYEGTNGIQAIDLVTRKIGREDGRVVSDLLDRIAKTAADSRGPIGDHLATAVAAVRDTTEWLIERLATSRDDALAGATAYLSIMGDLVGGWLLARAAIDHRTAGRPEADRAEAVAAFFAVERVASVRGRSVAVTAGATRLFI